MYDQSRPERSASVDVIAQIHNYAAQMVLNRAKECAENGEWDPSVISNALKLLSNEGIRASTNAAPLVRHNVEEKAEAALKDLGLGEFLESVINDPEPGA